MPEYTPLTPEKAPESMRDLVVFTRETIGSLTTNLMQLVESYKHGDEDVQIETVDPVILRNQRHTWKVRREVTRLTVLPQVPPDQQPQETMFQLASAQVTTSYIRRSRISNSPTLDALEHMAVTPPSIDSLTANLCLRKGSYSEEASSKEAHLTMTQTGDVFAGGYTPNAYQRNIWMPREERYTNGYKEALGYLGLAVNSLALGFPKVADLGQDLTEKLLTCHEGWGVKPYAPAAA